MSELVRYDAMCTAIAECHRLDEVKDIRDKARALEIYARQARNTDAERKASEIRLRAERRSGELLAELARADAGSARNPTGRRGKEPMSNDATQVNAPSPYAAALETTGLSRQTAHRYQQLAAVPKEDFEAALSNPQERPTTAKLIREARDPTPQIDKSAMWLWGRAMDFEDGDYRLKTPAEIMDAITPAMQGDMRRIVPMLADFYRELEEFINEFA